MDLLEHYNEFCNAFTNTGQKPSLELHGNGIKMIQKEAEHLVACQTIQGEVH